MGKKSKKGTSRANKGKHNRAAPQRTKSSDSVASNSNKAATPSPSSVSAAAAATVVAEPLVSIPNAFTAADEKKVGKVAPSIITKDLAAMEAAEIAAKKVDEATKPAVVEEESIAPVSVKTLQAPPAAMEKKAPVEKKKPADGTGKENNTNVTAANGIAKKVEKAVVEKPAEEAGKENSVNATPANGVEKKVEKAVVVDEAAPSSKVVVAREAIPLAATAATKGLDLSKPAPEDVETKSDDCACVIS